MYRVYLEHETHEVKIVNGKADVSEIPKDKRDEVVKFIKKHRK